MRPLLTVFACTVSALAADYRIEPAAGSRFALEVFKTGLMSGRKHHFIFERYSGTLQYDKDKPADSRVELEIEAASAVVKDEWIGEKNRKKVLEYALEEMLAVEKHPTLRFLSSRVEPISKNRFKVYGTLEIRSTPKPVEVEVAVSDSGAGLDLKGNSAIKLSAWGIKPRSATLGVIGTKDQMAVSFSLHANGR